MMTDENQSVVRLPAGTSEMEFGQKRRRRPLTVIDQNKQPCHPHLVNKRPHHDNTQSCMIYDDSVTYEKKGVPKSDVAVEEVEMEDMVDEEAILDIDGRDAKDPLSVADYVDDIYCYYRKMEACSIDYMSQQPDINDKMRAILIDWLIEVHHKFELRDETLFLTVSIIDRFLARHTVARNKLQLVGLIAMLLACKYEEVSVPIVDDLIFISDKAYTRHHLLQMERLILNTLEFNMSLPTPYVFLTRFLKAAESDRKLQLLSFYLTELSLVEYETIKFPPSLLAAAAVYTAQSTLYGFKQWNRTCEFYTNYSEHQLLECSKLIVSFHQKAATGKLNGVYRKYSTSKFGFAAECEPALFLMHHHTQVHN